MKVASTLLLTTLCCASAFGFHGPASNALKKVGVVAKNVPMVQPVDINGERSSSVTVRDGSHRPGWSVKILQGYQGEDHPGCLDSRAFAQATALLPTRCQALTSFAYTITQSWKI